MDVDQSQKPIPIRDGGYFHQSAFCFLEMLSKGIVQILDLTMDRELVWEIHSSRGITIEIVVAGIIKKALICPENI